MNTVVTSKEEILKTSRELIRQQGWRAVNIRSVAAACGVSVGSIYNYFDSKSDLAGATVDEGAELTDDCSAVERLGIGVILTPGDYRNLKITTPEDLAVAEALLEWEDESGESGTVMMYTS